MGGDSTSVRRGTIAIAILSFATLLLSFAHSCASGDMRWVLYDWQKALSMLLLSAWLFAYIHPKDSLMKAMALCWMLDSLKECVDVWVDGDANDWRGLVVQYAVITLIAMPGVFSVWNIKRLQNRYSKPASGMVYIAIAPPRRFATWWHFTTGVAPGSMSLAVINKGDALVFKFRREMTEIKTKVSEMGDHIFIPVPIGDEYTGELIRRMRSKVGVRWSLFGNCSKVTFEVLYSMGVPRSKVTVLPIIPILKLCFDDPRSDKPSNENNE